MKKTLRFILALTLVFGMLPTPTFAASETDTAVDYLVENGIFAGDQNGNLNLDRGLTRAELAVILTRLDFADTPKGLAEWDAWGSATFRNPDTRLNPFTDIPDWALPFVEYCYQRRLMAGVGDNKFDPQGKVNPKMACTVMLRYCATPETDWDYQTSVEKAQSIGIAPIDGTSGDALLRGTMALIIHRGLRYSQTGELPADMTGSISAPPQVTPVEPSENSMTIKEIKAEIIGLTNIERVKAGLSELEVLPELMDCAQAKADDMIATGYYGHNSPTYGAHNQMIRAFVPSATGGWENTTFGPASTPQDAFGAWLNSEGHRANILEPRITHIGIGCAQDADGRYAWVLQFISQA